MVKARIQGEILIISAAYVIAFIIWLMAKMSTLETDQVVVPVFIDNVPANIRLDFTPKSVPIIVKFPQSHRGRVVTQNFEVRLDAEEMFGDDPRHAWAGVREPIVHSYNLTLDNIHSINLPQSIRVTELGAQGRIRIEASLFTQAVPVKVVTQGSLPANYELRQEVKADPAEVLVTAPPEALKRLSTPGAEIMTEPVKLDEHKQDFMDYPSLLLPEGLELVDENQKKVQVFVGVQEKEVTRTIEGVPIEIYVFSENFKARITPPTAVVRVRGRVSVVERIVPGMFAFSSRESIAEETGKHKEIDLEASFDEDVPVEIRKNAEIEGFTPSKVDVEFVWAGKKKG